MIHVGMNIENKPALFAEARRVLKPSSVLAVYRRDADRRGRAELPGALGGRPGDELRRQPGRVSPRARGCRVRDPKERDRRAYAAEVFERVRANATTAGGPPPLGTHLLMKTDVPQKLAHAIRNLDQGLIAPVELICRAR